MINTVILECRAGTDVELHKHNENGKPVFASVWAFHNIYIPGAEDREPTQETWNITVKFGARTAPLAAAAITKGSTFIVVGQLNFSPAGEREGKTFEGYSFIRAQEISIKSHKPHKETKDNAHDDEA